MNEEEFSQVGVSTHYGFPNAAIGSHKQIIDLSQLLIKHPSATYLLRLGSKKVLIVDRAINPRPSDLVIWWEGEQFCVGNKSKVPKDTVTWGTVAHIINAYRPLIKPKK